MQPLLATDGAGSAMRREMSAQKLIRASEIDLEHGYKELSIPAGPHGTFRMASDALHIWPRGNFMLIALPNVDGTFACILFLPFEGAESFAQLATPSAVIKLFQSRFPDANPLMPNLAEDFFTNPTGAMVTIKCSPWHVDGQILLLGDAAHAIVPFFGQGINCGFEDCTCLLELLDRHGADWERVFSEFEKARKINTDAIADLAVENFVEMRDRVADPRFLFRKKVELALEAKYPQLFVPKYAMVTFHRIPYVTALQRGQVQDRMLTELCDPIDRLEDLDWNKADRLIRSQLTPLELLS
jgi:kynurenine 3-monooxygenase